MDGEEGAVMQFSVLCSVSCALCPVPCVTCPLLCVTCPVCTQKVALGWMEKRELVHPCGGILADDQVRRAPEKAVGAQVLFT